MGLSKSKPELKHQELTFVDSFGSSRRLKAIPGQTLLETAVENSVDISTSCGGMGTCGTCRVFLEVTNGLVPARNDIEKDVADEKNFAPNERLSCQIEIPDDDFSWSFHAPEETY